MPRKAVRPDDLTVKDVEKAIKHPAAKWQGCCHAVACNILKAGLVKGRAAYGHYLGFVSDKGYWAQHGGHPFQRHGWIVLDDGRILDPTRWSFENERAYIYVGENDGEYDEGGNQIRDLLHRSPPKYDKANKHQFVLALKPAAQAHVQMLLGYKGKKVTWEQMGWLASLSLNKLAPYAKDIFECLVEKRLHALIPIDNRSMVLGG